MKILAVHCHPDDIEFVISGTLFLLKDRGHEIHYMNVSNGRYGSMELSEDETIRTRREESIAACALLGATYHESISADMAVFYNDESIRKMAAVVRQVAPDIILTASPQDYMEDHMNTCRIALGGAFVRAMPLYRSDPPEPPVENDVVIYHAMPHGLVDGLRNPIVSDLHVDVGSVIEKKEAMLSCHKSQKDFLDRTQGLDSYIRTMKDLNADLARQVGGMEYAEGFRRHLHFGYAASDTDPLAELLADTVTVRKE